MTSSREKTVSFPYPDVTLGHAIIQVGDNELGAHGRAAAAQSSRRRRIPAKPIEVMSPTALACSSTAGIAGKLHEKGEERENISE